MNIDTCCSQASTGTAAARRWSGSSREVSSKCRRRVPALGVIGGGRRRRRRVVDDGKRGRFAGRARSGGSEEDAAEADANFGAYVAAPLAAVLKCGDADARRDALQTPSPVDGWRWS